MLSHMLRVPLASGGGYPDIASSVKTQSASSASTLVVTMPSGIVAGNLLVVILTLAGTTASGWTGPAGWTSLAGAQGHSIFYRIATGSETSTYTFTAPATAVLLASALRITGNHASAAPEIQVTSSSTGTTAADPPSLTPSWGSATTLWLTVLSCGTAYVFLGFSSYPANYTFQQTAVDGGFSGACHFFAGRKLTATSDNPGAFASSGSSGRYLVATIAIRPA